MLQTLRLNERFCVICDIEFYEFGIFVYSIIVVLCGCVFLGLGLYDGGIDACVDQCG